MKEVIKKMNNRILIKKMKLNKIFLNREIKFKNLIFKSKNKEEVHFKNNRKIKFKQLQQISVSKNL
jgi:hypothetical protein